MANTKTAKKRIKVIAAATLRNKVHRSSLRTAIKKAHQAMEGGTENKVAAVNSAVSQIDSAVSKGILHKNTAARKKSKLVRKLNAAS